MHSTHDKHEFAFFSTELTQLAPNAATISITQKDLAHRIGRVLRLAVGESIVLFDGTRTVYATIKSIEKSRITFAVAQHIATKKITPAIHWILPLLEKTALEESLYALCAMGATSIQLVTAQKCHVKKITPEYVERLHKILIAAAEQAKQFALPNLLAPVSLATALEKHQGTLIFFDADGAPAQEITKKIAAKADHTLTCLIGPEGDFSPEEKDMIGTYAPEICALTPTILTAWHATIVGMGLWRSMLK